MRTIQRVETAGKSSRETKLCLAATFNVDLADLEVKPHVINTTRRSNWVAATLFLLTATVSCIGLYNDVSNPLFFIANLTAISTFIYSVFSWYFASAPTLRADMRTTVNAGFIYLAIFAFSRCWAIWGRRFSCPCCYLWHCFAAYFSLSTDWWWARHQIQAQTEGVSERLPT
ncbi:hypothetical protein [Shewanella dokdonensis]|uniref:hypothetical protein n=1 Tax=Shewanella dokdonensis TaxID=712036 RepID=UPI003CC7C8C2